MPLIPPTRKIHYCICCKQVFPRKQLIVRDIDITLCNECDKEDVRLREVVAVNALNDDRKQMIMRLDNMYRGMGIYESSHPVARDSIFDTIKRQANIIKKSYPSELVPTPWEDFKKKDCEKTDPNRNNLPPPPRERSMELPPLGDSL